MTVCFEPRSGSKVSIELSIRRPSGLELALDLAGARHVVTEEEALDEQTLHGKAPAGVATAAATAGVPV